MYHHSMNFDLGEDINALRDAVHRFVQTRIKPMAQEIDKNNLFPHGPLLSQGRRGVGEVLQKTLSMVIESSARGC